MKSYAVVKRYFSEGPHGRKVTLDELKALSKDERDELAGLAAVEMGLVKQPNGEFA
jgi:hypothetical protein